MTRTLSFGLRWLLRAWAGFSGYQAAACPRLDIENERLVTTGSAGTRLFPEQVRMLIALSQLPTPSRLHSQQVTSRHKRVGLSQTNMKTSTRPPIIPGLITHLRANRVQLNVRNSRQEVRLVHNTRVKPALEQVAALLLSKVDHARIRLMRSTDRKCQTVFSLGNSDKVNVIRHQTPSSHFDAVRDEMIADKLEVSLAVFVAEENTHRAHTTLRYMMRATGNNNTSNPRHKGNLNLQGTRRQQLRCMSPELNTRFLVGWSVLATTAQPTAAQSVLRVNAQASGVENGTSWSDAFCDLHDALSVAKSGDEIWIVAGTYKPDRGSGDRTMQFQVKSGVALYGGFAGFETQRGQRDWINNETILSGDLNGDDGPFNCSEVSNCCQEHAEPGCDDAECEALVCNSSESCCKDWSAWVWEDSCVSRARTLCCDLGSRNLCDNSYRVVDASWVDNSTILNGLTVAGGYAIYSIEGVTGGGVIVESGAPRLENCIVRGHSIGIFQYSESHTEVHNCLVIDNLSFGIFGIHNSDLTIRSSTISSNLIGVRIPGGNTTIADSTLSDNLREGLGGGDRSSQVLVTGSTFLRNGFGGIQSSGGDYIIRDCLFADNIWGATGGVSIRDTALIERCAFIGNSAHSTGAVKVGGSVTVRDSLFVGNSAEHGCILIGQGVLWLHNSTLVSNRGGISAALSVNDPVSLAFVDNTVIWGNLGHPSIPSERQQIFVLSSFGADLRINHSIVEGWTGLYGGVGNSGVDPLFVDADGADATPGTADDDLRLLPGSPAINTGDPTLIPEPR